MKKNIILWNTGPISENFSFYTFRTLGAYKIAHTVRKSGYTCQVIDHILKMSVDDLYRCSKKFIDEKTQVLGISTTFLLGAGIERIPDSIVQVLNLLLKEYPKLKIVFGGYNINKLYSSRLNLATNKIFAIPSYGEDIFLDFVNYCNKKNTFPRFQITENNGIKIFILFDSLVKTYNIETDDFLFDDDDCIMPNETLPIEISRGCIFKCKFCNHLMLGRGKLDYLRDIELIKNNMIHNYNKWGITNYYIICDTFNDTEIKMKRWYDMVKSLPFKVSYTAYLRADLLEKFQDVPYMLKESGLFTGFHGIETLGESSSQLIGKGWSGKKARYFIPELYHNIWKKEVHQTISFIVGLEGDTVESVNDNIDWFIENNLFNAVLHPLMLDKENKNRSEFEKNAESYGYNFLDQTTEWQNKYWNFSLAKDTTTKLVNKLGKKTSLYGSWDLMHIKQYDVDLTNFTKEDSWRPEFSPKRLKEMSDQYIINYIEKLLEL